MAYRKDRDITKEIPYYRQMLIHLNPGRKEGIVWFTQTLDLTHTQEWLDRHNAEHEQKLSFLLLFMTAVARVLHQRPHLNRYVAGYRIFQRDGVTISVSAKKQLRDKAKVVVLKVPIEPDDKPEDVQRRFQELLGEGRSGKEIGQEKEARVFLKIPGFLLKRFIGLVKWLNGLHWLPAALTDPDPFFTSMFVANLGSVGLDAGYHHLYEYGTASYFAVLGQFKDAPVVVDGKVEVRKVVEIKYTFDERSEDALAVAIGLAGLKQMVERPETFYEDQKDLGDLPPEQRVTAR